MSWRDSVSQTAQDDFDQLTGMALGFATEQITKTGELYPLALAVDVDGNLEPIQPGVAGEHPSASEVAVALVAEAHRRAPDLRAAAFVADVTAQELGGDAIRVLLEHREGATLALYLPYRSTPEGPDFGELIGGMGSAQIWV